MLFAVDGYLLERNSTLVGAILRIFSTVHIGDAPKTRCNVSSWYVDPAVRSYAPLLVAQALKHERTDQPEQRAIHPLRRRIRAPDVLIPREATALFLVVVILLWLALLLLLRNMSGCGRFVNNVHCSVLLSLFGQPHPGMRHAHQGEPLLRVINRLGYRKALCGVLPILVCRHSATLTRWWNG